MHESREGLRHQYGISDACLAGGWREKHVLGFLPGYISLKKLLGDQNGLLCWLLSLCTSWHCLLVPGSLLCFWDARGDWRKVAIDVMERKSMGRRWNIEGEDCHAINHSGRWITAQVYII